MFLKQEKPEMDDLEEEKNFDSKGKILKNVNSLRKYFEKVFNGYPRKNVTKNFAYFFRTC